MEDDMWQNFLNLIRNEKGNDQSLLNARIDVKYLKKHGATLPSYAAKYGDLEAIEFLVQKGADCNVMNADGSNPLHIAAKYGHKHIAKFFLDLRVSVNSCDNNNCTPLHYVARKSTIPLADREHYLELARYLVDSNANVNAVNRTGCTPLLLAAQNSFEELVELLMEFGANVECCDEHQWTILHHSSLKWWSRIVQSLVEGKSDLNINATTSTGYTPLIMAAYSAHKYAVKLLLESGANVECLDSCNWTVLHFACKFGWFGIVKSLVNKKFDLNSNSTRGCTPLHVAAKYSRYYIVQYLIESECDVECTDNNEYTVLHYACENGWLGVVKSLVNRQCELNAKNSVGDTPLLLAAMNLHSDVVEYLIESGAIVECQGSEEWTVLHYACIEGWLDVVKSLINKGCDINIPDICSDTPLHVAIRSCYNLEDRLEIIGHLLKAGAEYNFQNNRGATAFNEFIKRHLCLEGIALFLEQGAYFQSDDYVAIIEKPYLKEGILHNTTLCTRAVMNKFNNSDLPKVYKIPVVSESLPPIAKLKIVNNRNVAKGIAQIVEYDIETKGYCNVLDVRPKALSILCVGSLVEHYYN